MKWLRAHAKLITFVLFAAVVVYGFTITQDTEHRFQKAHNELCVSHQKLIGAVRSASRAALTPLVPVDDPTAAQLATNANANAQKAARLEALEKKITAARPCPHV